MMNGTADNLLIRKLHGRKVRPCPYSRRGTVLVAIVAFLLLSEVAIIGLVLNTARHQYLAVDRLDTVRSFYASEGGMNMAVREVLINVDEDGDGVIGTISDDANGTNDPKIGDGRVFVTSQVVGPKRLLTSNGRSGKAARQLIVTFQ